MNARRTKKRNVCKLVLLIVGLCLVTANFLNSCVTTSTEDDESIVKQFARAVHNDHRYNSWIRVSWKRRPWYKQECLDRIPKTQLYHQVKTWGHVGERNFHDKHAADATTFLYNLRHPVDRVISAYWHHHPMRKCGDKSRHDGTCKALDLLTRRQQNAKEFFFECFPGAEDLAQALAEVDGAKTNTSTAVSSKCHVMVVEAIAAHFSDKNFLRPFYMQDYINHIAESNYRFYFNKSLGQWPEKEVLAVRTYHLWDDMIALEKWLGGNGDLHGCAGMYHTHGAENIIDKGPVSPSGYKLFCCALQEEMLIYYELLLRSANLSPSDKEETWSKDLEKCGATSMRDLEHQCADSSPFDMKLWKEKIMEGWGENLLESTDAWLVKERLREESTQLS